MRVGNDNMLFVYGSLLEGLGNHSLLLDEETVFLGTCSTDPIYTMLNLNAFPGVVGGGETSIMGEVYRVSDAVWDRVERLEGYPSFYDRTTITTPYGDASMYILDRDTRYTSSSRVVESGSWRDR